MSPRDADQVGVSASGAETELPAETSVGPIHLTVSDLERSVAYYRDEVGLALITEEATQAALGAGGRELVVLTEEPGAEPALGHTGLYHFALLVPQRRDLARWLAHARRERVAMIGASDHFVSEALYLSDPDFHGIEIYWDRPRQLWEGRVAETMTTLPLDLGDLLAEVGDAAMTPFEGLPAETRMGHVHLRVREVGETIAFYRDVLGLSLMAQLGSQAAFLGAGGYHHHIGANTWESAGAAPPPPGSAALRHATLVLPGRTAVDAAAARLSNAGHDPSSTEDGILAHDPSGNALLLASA